MTSIEREEKEKVKKREKKLEDEETMQQATWVKYTFPIKHQVCRLRPHRCRPVTRSAVLSCDRSGLLLWIDLLLWEMSALLNNQFHSFCTLLFFLYPSFPFFFSVMCEGVEAERRGVSCYRLRGLELDQQNLRAAVCP